MASPPVDARLLIPAAVDEGAVLALLSIRMTTA